MAVLLKKDRVESGDSASFRFSFVLPEKLIPSFKVRHNSIPRAGGGILEGLYFVACVVACWSAVLLLVVVKVWVWQPARPVLFSVVVLPHARQRTLSY